FLLATLAARFALLQAPEAVQAFEAGWSHLRAAEVIGTGPFVCAARADDLVQFSAHAAGHRPPLLDGLEVHAPGSGDIDAFLARRLDEVILRDRRDAAPLRVSAGAQAQELRRFE